MLPDHGVMVFRIVATGQRAAGGRLAGALASAALLTACTPHLNHEVTSIGIPAPGQALSVPGGDYRLVFARSPARDGAPSELLCVEPSPDWATTYATNRALNASATTPTGVQASAGGSFSETATISQMLGRTAGVVALRDGLYQACQAHANGLLSANDYALILSQFGTLLIALVGSGSSPGAAAPAATAAQIANTHVQALLVTCLRVYETDDPHNVALRRILDTATCSKLMKDVGALVPHLGAAEPTSATSEVKAPAAPMAPSVAAACTDADRKPAGQPVALQQFALKLAKAYAGPLDGREGPITRAAILSFQAINQLCTNGIVNQATARKLGF